MGEKKLCCGRRKPKISPSVSAPLHLILQTPRGACHEWNKSGGSHFKVCQVCHLTLDGGGIRCKDCGLCAHPHCAAAFPPLTPNPSLLTGTTASIRSSSVPPFEPRIKRLKAPPSGASEHSHLSSSTPIQIIIDEAVDSPRSQPKSPPMTATPDLHPVISSKEQRQPTNKHSLTYVDGPVDGALYALVKPKGPSSADSGISVTVDQMKDLDRLLDALVEDAESIPDIPYHARQDSLPFSYGITHNALQRKPLTHQPDRFQSKRQEWTATRQEQTPHFDSTPVYARSKSDDGWRTPLQQRDTSSPPHYATVTSSMETSPLFHSPEPFRTQNVNFTSTPIQHTIPTTTTRPQTNGQQRLRSASADGRRSEDADAWLKRQMDKLHEKRLAKNQSKRNEWLEELKRTFPPQSRQPSEEVNRVSEPQQTECVRPSSVARVYSRSTASTPAFFSSDDEDFDTEVETAYNEGPPSFYGSSGRGLGYSRKLERVHSDTAFDRMRSSEQSTGNYSTIGSRSSGSDLQRNTPRFPTCPPTPYLNRPNSPAKPPRSPKSTHRTILTTSTPSTPTANSGEGDWTTWREEPKSQNVNPRPVFVVESEVKFARDLSCFWYKPNASREETIAALRFQGPGAFVLRNSNSFPGAFGLAIKVDARGSAEETVRHFLIEPTKYGVRLRGSAIEPVFSSLSALVYAHSIEPLALPITLSLPSSDCVLPETQSESTTAHLLNQGAACQLLFLGLSGVECVTGEDAVSRGVKSVIGLQTPTVVSLRLAKQGLTLTDVFRQRFFRLHFPLAGISFAALDTERRTITYDQTKRRIFGVIARTATGDQNSCVVLAELEDGQPANAIVSFFQRVIAWNAN